ncbi:MAG: hypothetical protein AAFQ02_01215 [Bacteroidota bacterium]
MNRIFWMMVICSMVACRSDYERYVLREQQATERVTELLFDLHIGQSQKDFYATCWELNKQEIISHGPNNQFAQYQIPAEELPGFDQSMRMLFYGIFDQEGTMQGMDIRFSCPNWSPWNKALQAKALAAHVQDYFMHLYGGNDFITIDIDDKDVKGYVKIDANRHILVYPKDAQQVVAKIEDMAHRLNKNS